MTTHRAARILGAGVVSPAGSTVEDAWDQVLLAAGTNAQVVHYAQLPDNPALICRARGFTPADKLDRHELRRLDRSHQMAFLAADDALSEAGPGPPPERSAVVVGVGFGAADTYERQFEAFAESGLRAVSPLTIPIVMVNSVAAHLSIRYGFTGPAITLSSACASGTAAIGEAMWLLRTGRADRVLAGGVDAMDVAHVVGGFLRMEAMSTRFSDPRGSSRPFDSERDGFVLGEGAGFVVLERADESTGGRGVVLGYATNSDACHIVAPAEQGSGAMACMRDAIVDAAVEPADIAHVNAHGTSTQRNDLAEAQAIAALFGRRMPVTASKSVTGHLIGAAGAFEAIITAESLRTGRVPPTANVARIDPEIEQLVKVTSDSSTPAGHIAISNSFGFGGHNATLVLGTRL